MNVDDITIVPIQISSYLQKEMSVKARRLPPNFLGVLRGHEGVVTTIFFINETDDAITVPSLISGSDCGEIFIWNMKVSLLKLCTYS